MSKLLATLAVQQRGMRTVMAFTVWNVTLTLMSQTGKLKALPILLLQITDFVLLKRNLRQILFSEFFYINVVVRKNTV